MLNNQNTVSVAMLILTLGIVGCSKKTEEVEKEPVNVQQETLAVESDKTEKLTANEDKQENTVDTKNTETQEKQEIEPKEPEYADYEVTAESLSEFIPADLNKIKLPEDRNDDSPLTYQDVEVMRNNDVKIGLKGENSRLIRADETPQDIIKAEIIDLSGSNLLIVPSWLRKFTNLKKLDLSNANIPFNELDKLPNMPQLEQLYLSGNKLFEKKLDTRTDAQRWLIFLKKIQNVYKLNLANNGNKHYVPSNLHFLKNVTEIDLSGNRISLSTLGLDKLAQLKKLNLTNTGLSDSGLMEKLPLSSLINLKLNKNHLEKLEFHGDLPYLENLEIEDNPLNREQEEQGIKLDEKYGADYLLKSITTIKNHTDALIPMGLQKKLWYRTLNEEEKALAKKGVYTDKNTGLQWMRCSLGQTWKDGTCEGEPKRYKWEEINSLKTKLNYAGLNGWRLPTIEELNTVLFCSKGFNRKEGNCNPGSKGPMINELYFPNMTIYAIHWSATPDLRNDNSSWFVRFGLGYFGTARNKDSSYVLAVRGSSESIEYIYWIPPKPDK